MQELDDDLSREYTLLEDGVGLSTQNMGDVLRSFAQHCQQVALVGSCRRGVAKPNDVDILYIPKNNLQVMEFLERVTDDESQIRCENGGWTCPVKGRRVDFIQSSPTSWGMDLVYFTGSREFNERVLRHAIRRGYTVEKHRPMTKKQGGYGSFSVLAFEGWSEDKILNHLGLAAFLDPRKRELRETNDDVPLITDGH